MYQHIKWEDRVTEFSDLFKETQEGSNVRHTPVEGSVIVEGTPLDAANLGQAENGLLDTSIALQILLQAYYAHRRESVAHHDLMDAEVLGETQDVTLTNTDHFPFNSTNHTPVTVNLTKKRKNLFYTIETEVKSHTGEVGNIEITYKALNYFKLNFTGSGSKAVITTRIKGGMT